MTMELKEKSEKMIKKIDMGKMEIKDLQEFLESVKEADTTDYIKLLNDTPDLFIKLLPVGASLNLKDFAPLISEIISVTLEKMEEYRIEKFLSGLSKPEVAFFPGIIISIGRFFEKIGEEKIKEYKEETRDISSAIFQVIDKTAMPIGDMSDDPMMAEAFDEIACYRSEDGEMLCNASFDFYVEELGFTFNIKIYRDEELDKGRMQSWTLFHGMKREPEATLHWTVTTKGLLYMLVNILATGGELQNFFDLTAAGEITFEEEDMPGAGLLPWFIDISEICKKIGEAYPKPLG
jgi:hypothetical protein